MRISAFRPALWTSARISPSCPVSFCRCAARLAQLDPAALDLADAKAAPDERVQAHAARRQLAARLARRELDAGVRARRSSSSLSISVRCRRLRARLEVAVAAQARAGDSLDAVDRVNRA